MPKAHGAGDEAEPRRHCVASMAHDAVGSRARHWNVPQAEPLTATPQVRTGVGQGSFRMTRPRECPVKGRQPEHPYDPAGAPQVGGHVGLELRGMPPCAAPIAGWLTSCADALFK